MTATVALTQISTDQLAHRNASNGGHFFDADSKRFFSSRIGSTAYCSQDGFAFFVTSERRGFRDTSRGFTVRIATTHDGDMHGDFGGFNAFVSRSAADRAARRLAAFDSTFIPASNL